MRVGAFKPRIVLAGAACNVIMVGSACQALLRVGERAKGGRAVCRRWRADRVMSRRCQSRRRRSSWADEGADAGTGVWAEFFERENGRIYLVVVSSAGLESDMFLDPWVDERSLFRKMYPRLEEAGDSCDATFF